MVTGTQFHSFVRKVLWIFLLCLPATVFINCDEGFYDVYSSGIKIVNKSSQNLHVRFSPEKIQIDKNTQIYGYKPVDVEKGEFVTFTVTYKSYVPPGYYVNAMVKSPKPNDNIKKIFFLGMDNKKLIKEVKINSQDGLFKMDYPDNPFSYILKITDELLE